jgi:hypothetical protein
MFMVNLSAGCKKFDEVLLNPSTDGDYDNKTFSVYMTGKKQRHYGNAFTLTSTHSITTKYQPLETYPRNLPNYLLILCDVSFASFLILHIRYLDIFLINKKNKIKSEIVLICCGKRLGAAMKNHVFIILKSY